MNKIDVVTTYVEMAKITVADGKIFFSPTSVKEGQNLVHVHDAPLEYSTELANTLIKVVYQSQRQVKSNNNKNVR